MSRRPDPVAVAVVTVAAYNLIQNLVVPERWYTPANMVVSAGLVAHARRWGVTDAELGLVPGNVGRALALSGGVAAVTVAVTEAAARSPRLSTLLLDDRARGHGRRQAAEQLMVRFPLGTALFEELAFRGVLQSLFARRLGEARATIVTSLAFGLWHVVPTLRLYPGMAGGRTEAGPGERAAATGGSVAVTTAAGFLFDRLRRRSGTLLAPWLAHAGFSAISYLAARRAWNRA